MTEKTRITKVMDNEKDDHNGNSHNSKLQFPSQSIATEMAVPANDTLASWTETGTKREAKS